MCELLYTSKARLVVNPPCHSVAFDMFACVIYLCALLMCVVHITVSVVWMWYNVHIYVARARWLTPCVTPCHGCVSQSPSGRGRNSRAQCWLHHSAFLQCWVHIVYSMHAVPSQNANFTTRPSYNTHYTIEPSHNAYYTVRTSIKSLLMIPVLMIFTFINFCYPTQDHHSWSS